MAENDQQKSNIEQLGKSVNFRRLIAARQQEPQPIRESVSARALVQSRNVIANNIIQHATQATTTAQPASQQPPPASVANCPAKSSVPAKEK
jgi:hypothetical protein